MNLSLYIPRVLFLNATVPYVVNTSCPDQRHGRKIWSWPGDSCGARGISRFSTLGFPFFDVEILNVYPPVTNAWGEMRRCCVTHPFLAVESLRCGFLAADTKF